MAVTTEAWLFFFEKDGEEVLLVGRYGPEEVIPFVAVDTLRRNTLWPLAEKFAHDNGTSIIVRHFSADGVDVVIIGV